tara:strand:- start:75 stop:296 length:222 start_codon:yes stop_codon:yes gene_type:complete
MFEKLKDLKGNHKGQVIYMKDEIDKIKKEFAKTELRNEESKLSKKDKMYKEKSYRLLSRIEKIYREHKQKGWA